MDNARFSHIRKAVLGWSQQRLADQLGMARNTITRMESGVMPVELRTELAIRWLMFRECNIVEQVDQVKQVADCNMVEQVDQARQVVDCNMAEQVDQDDCNFIRSCLVNDGWASDSVEELFKDAFERWRMVHADYPNLVSDIGFRDAYAAWGSKVWLNIRSLRAAVREHLKIPF